MPTYYLYFQDGSGHILRRLDLQFESDEVAINWVEKQGGPGAMELWLEGRRVKVFNPNPDRKPH